MSEISFHTEDITQKIKENTLHREWLKEIAGREGFSIIELNYIFCSDAYLHRINLQYLEHDTYTDIVTFDNSDDVESKSIEGDIFISIDRVSENASKFYVTQEDELNRVMAHGLLHLMGYGDKTPADKLVMKGKEEECLDLFRNIKSK